MYGFGDDRNPANDTVNVMEEILVEYIVDVVRCDLYFALCFVTETPTNIVSNIPCTREEVTAIYRGFTTCVVQTSRREKARSYGGTAFHAGGYKESSRPVRRVRYEPGCRIPRMTPR